MIPYFLFDTFSLGLFTIHVWGLFAALGFLVATIVAARRARLLKMNEELVWQASWQIVLASMVGARVFEVLFYEPAYYWANPARIFAVWEGGSSSYGGIIGGAVALLWFIRRHKLPLLATLDIFAYAAPLGLMFGRIGCFLIHDHPGTITSFILGVQYPDGIRHDGGLEMAIADGFIFLVMIATARRYVPSPRRTREEGRGEGQPLPAGSFILLFLGLKGLSRFWLDFYRAMDLVGSETRYVGLTPSQYVGLFSMLVVAAVVVLRYWRSLRRMLQ